MYRKRAQGWKFEVRGSPAEQPDIINFNPFINFPAHRDLSRSRKENKKKKKKKKGKKKSKALTRRVGITDQCGRTEDTAEKKLENKKELL